jgi:chromosome segregation ATPase
MSNTYVNIKSTNSSQKHSNRTVHNERQTNLSTGDFKGQECLNIVEKVPPKKDQGHNVYLQEGPDLGGIGTYADNLKKMRRRKRKEAQNCNNILKSLSKDYSNVVAKFENKYLKKEDHENSKEIDEYLKKIEDTKKQRDFLEDEIKDLDKKIKEIPKSKSEISKDISKYKSLIKNYEKDLVNYKIILENSILKDDEKDISKYSKLVEKREKQIIKHTQKIQQLMTLRDNTKSRHVEGNKNKNRNDYVEITLSITKCPDELKRDQEYGKTLLDCVKDFYRSLDLDMEVESYSLHMDQSSPHCHILGNYKNSDSSIQKDLLKHFGKKFNYHSLQNGFNEFVRNYPNLQKYDHIKDLEKIERGGKFEYIKNLDLYKKSQSLEELEQKENILNNQFEDKKKVLDKVNFKISHEQKKYDKLLKNMSIVNNVIEKYKVSQVEYEYQIKKELDKYEKLLGGISRDELIENISNFYKPTSGLEAKIIEHERELRKYKEYVEKLEKINREHINYASEIESLKEDIKQQNLDIKDLKFELNQSYKTNDRLRDKIEEYELKYNINDKKHHIDR